MRRRCSNYSISNTAFLSINAFRIWMKFLIFTALKMMR